MTSQLPNTILSAVSVCKHATPTAQLLRVIVPISERRVRGREEKPVWLPRLCPNHLATRRHWAYFFLASHSRESKRPFPGVSPATLWPVPLESPIQRGPVLSSARAGNSCFLVVLPIQTTGNTVLES